MDNENSQQQADQPAAGSPPGSDQASPVFRQDQPSAVRPALSAECGEVTERLGRIEKSLQQVVDHLDQTQREQRVQEFSLSHLAGVLCLVLSVVFIVGAVLSLLRADVNLGRGWAAVAFLGAISMQGLSLALFALSRRE